MKLYVALDAKAALYDVDLKVCNIAYMKYKIIYGVYNILYEVVCRPWRQGRPLRPRPQGT